MPEVAVYEGPANAFATGAFRDSALVAVSTGLVDAMSREEVEAVLGHEISHVANGDMVTLTLIQGVLNTFVFFLSRVVGMIVDKVVFRTERGLGPGFYVTMIVCQILFGIAASAIVAWFSRRREFRADAGSAGLLHSPQPMIAALSRLGSIQSGGLPDQVKAFGINSNSGLAALFATHPPIERRIAALQGQ
jgi:heat shock protein HtpX